MSCFLEIKALMVISMLFGLTLSLTTNGIYAALSLIAVIVSTSLILWLLGAEFLAMMYIIVYLGAVAVLFLFVVMMLTVERGFNVNRRDNLKLNVNSFFSLFASSKQINFWFKSLKIFYTLTEFVYLSLVFSLTVLIIFIPLGSDFSLFDEELFVKLNNLNFLQNTAQIGELLYVEFGFLFILSSFILLVAMIGAILLTVELPTGNRQNIISQSNKDLKTSIALYKIAKR